MHRLSPGCDGDTAVSNNPDVCPCPVVTIATVTHGRHQPQPAASEEETAVQLTTSCSWESTVRVKATWLFATITVFNFVFNVFTRLPHVYCSVLSLYAWMFVFVSVGPSLCKCLYHCTHAHALASPVATSSGQPIGFRVRSFYGNITGKQITKPGRCNMTGCSPVHTKVWLQKWRENSEEKKKVHFYTFKNLNINLCVLNTVTLGLF